MVKSTVQDPKPEGKTHPPTSLKVYVLFQLMMKKVHMKSLNLFNHRLVLHVHVQLHILFWSLVLSQSLDLLRLLFHVRVSVLMSLAAANGRRRGWVSAVSRDKRHSSDHLKNKPEPSKITANLIICWEDSHLIPIWGSSFHFYKKRPLWKNNLGFLELIGTPADYLITAIWDHNNPQSAVLYSILRLLSHGESGKNENRNSVTANFWLTLLLHNHWAGFVPSLWLIFPNPYLLSLHWSKTRSRCGTTPICQLENGFDICQHFNLNVSGWNSSFSKHEQSGLRTG